MKIGRNDLCFCGSGKRYKKCCLGSEIPEEFKHQPKHVLPDRWNIDFGEPHLDKDFFDCNGLAEISAAKMLHMSMALPDVMEEVAKQVRQETTRHLEQGREIESLSGPHDILQFLKKDPDRLNYPLILKKFPEHEDGTVELLLEELRTNDNEIFVELAVRLLYDSDLDFVDELVEIIEACAVVDKRRAAGYLLIMKSAAERPLIVQSDLTLLLEVDSPCHDEVRDAIAPFAEIIKSPEHMHTYCITPISLWNAASIGLDPEEVMRRLTRYSRFDIAATTAVHIGELMGRYGQIRLERQDELCLKLTTQTSLLMERFFHIDAIRCYFTERFSATEALIRPFNRGLVKQAFIKEGYPVMDLAGYAKGADLTIGLKPSLDLRLYQCRSRDAFLKGGSDAGGCGVVVLPCGAGKTIVGIAILAQMKTHTLILVTNTTAARQWKQELLDKAHVAPEDIGEFSGEVKVVKPVTIATYQILTHRGSKEDGFTHFDTIDRNPWGLIIYDEVHLLPAQMFRFTASLQAIRRLGLTATLVREDGREADVFSLIGPKSYDMAWKEIERQGWIAKGYCHEIRVDMDPSVMMAYVTSPKRQRFRIASENPAKIAVIRQLLARHEDKSALIIGQYISQLRDIARVLELSIITGETLQEERDALYARFRSGEIKILVVSSVANFSIDLPEASVAIEVSGRFGSRQEEAQRFGRILRPKKTDNAARFYTLVSRGTEEQDFALNRQMFLTEQGYNYTILHESQLTAFLNGNITKG